MIQLVGEYRVLRTGERRDRPDVGLVAAGEMKRSGHPDELRQRRLDPLVDDAVPAQQVRRPLPHSVARGRLYGRLHDARVICEPQVVVAAEREEFPAIDDDARSLCTLACETTPQESLSLDIGEPVGKSLEDHGCKACGPVSPVA